MGQLLAKLRVDGQPLPMPRPRISKYGGVFSGGKEIREYKKKIATEAQKAWKNISYLPVKVQVGLHVEFFRNDRRQPDLDNLLKTVQDALLGIAYLDDRQIVEVHARRFDGCARPAVSITLLDMEAVP